MNSNPLSVAVFELASQDRPRAERPLLALDRDVAGEASEVLLPRDGCVARQIGDRGDVGVARSLPDLTGGEAREAGPVLEHSVERLARVDRHELRARPRVHVDELREHELDPARLHVLPDGVRGYSLSHSSRLLSSAPDWIPLARIPVAQSP